MKIQLTEEEKENLEYLHSQERDKNISDRIKSILLRDEGWSVSKIAQALRLHNDTVSRYIIGYINEKKIKPNHQGSNQKLNGDQTMMLIAHLNEKLYDKASAIAAYVKITYDIDYTANGMVDWLKRHNFTYKQSRGYPSKADTQKQEEFINIYKELKESAPKEEPILFMDSVHPTMATKMSYGWVFKGSEKFLPTTASRTRVNIAGTIELSTMKVVTGQYNTINGESITDFFKIIKDAYPSAAKLHIILDQSGYHRSEAVKKHAEQHGIILHFLPPYSPNLNPIERLWKFMNEHVRNNKYFKSAKEFREQIDDFFKSKIPIMTNQLKSRINDNFHVVKTAKSF